MIIIHSHKSKIMDSYLNACLVILTTLVIVTNPQKVPPGVNPNTYQHQPQQQYQQPPPPQQVQYQQQPVQGVVPQDVQYQAPIQHQQPPPPQLNQPPPPQLNQPPPPQQYQPPPQQQPSHGHHDHQGQPQLLNTANLAEEREHMQEHLNVNIDTSKMTEQELQFHYFKMHDSDNNNKLDGCELIKSLIHWHEGEDKENNADSILKTDEELSFAVDNLLKSLDVNSDGFVDWAEFLADK